jgi:hypothetical protein
MSTLARVVALLVALSSAFLDADAAECDAKKVLAALQPLKSAANYWPCQSEAIAGIICSGTSCESLVVLLAALELPNCTVTGTDVDFNPAELKRLTSSVCEQGSDSDVKIKRHFAQVFMKAVLEFLVQ